MRTDGLTDGLTNGRTDGRTDMTKLIVAFRFLRKHTKSIPPKIPNAYTSVIFFEFAYIKHPKLVRRSCEYEMSKGNLKEGEYKISYMIATANRE